MIIRKRKVIFKILSVKVRRKLALGESGDGDSQLPEGCDFDVIN